MTEKKARKEIEVLVYKRETILQRINVLETKAATLTLHSEPDSLSEFRVRFERLHGHYESFSRIQSELARFYLLLEEHDKVEELQTVNQQTDDKYYRILALKEQLTPARPTDPNEGLLPTEPETAKVNAKLPKITLPIYDGVLKEWPNFKDLFLSLVHTNKALTNIEKFHYLLTCTKNEPNALVRSLPLSADNYDVIWNQLLDRYDNKRLLATHYVEEILNLPAVSSESPKPLRNLLDLLSENTQALKSMNIPGSLGDFLILQTALKKVDRHTRQLFERKLATTEFPTLDDFLNFLREHCKCLEVSLSMNNTRPQYNSFKQSDYNFKYGKKPSLGSSSPVRPTLSKAFLARPSTGTTQCLFCSENHSIYACSDFLKLNISDRRDFVRSKQACFNCLSSAHMLNKCNSIHRCRKCAKRHHSSLHDESFVPNTTAKPAEPKSLVNSKVAETSDNTELKNPVSSLHSSAYSTYVTTLLGTALIELQDSARHYHTVRALIDPGSQGSFISESCVNKLNLPRKKCYQPIMGLSQTVVHGARGNVTCFIKPCSASGPTLQTNAIILSRITSSLPSVRLSPDIKHFFKDFILADPAFDVPDVIDFLIGADLFPQVFDGGRFDPPPGYPTPFSTVFGWVLIGQTTLPSPDSQVISANLAISDNNSNLETCLKRFWETEEISATNQPRYSSEDEQCESIYVKTHTRDQSGRYIVKLPFKNEPPHLGDSYSRAQHCLFSLEKRFLHNPDLKASYIEFMEEYEALGHMTRLSSDTETPAYFIPHHGIFKSSDQKSKLRVVFNASAQTQLGNSLNSELLIGPKLQSDIFQILSRFRLHPFVFSTDICKMYRQILIHPDHCKYQAILWRRSPDLPIETYQLNTVTYGVSCSPYLALRTLKQLAIDEAEKYPLAAQVILQDTYVDDCLTGSDSLQAILELKYQLTNLFKLAGFELKKWSSNTPEVLLDVHTYQQEFVFDEKNEKEIVKILGLKWVPQTDICTYHAPVIDTPPTTKRGVLSYISRLYDPLGLVTPTVCWAKQLMQQLWSIGLSWDDSLPDDIYLQWVRFCNELPILATLRIPRFVLTSSFKDAQLHGFCDASEKGFACCLYLRITDQEDSVSVHLVSAKSKVAPLKRLTVPKLELSGAYLLTKLIKTYKKTLQNTRLNAIKTYAWTDSMVCLTWIRTSPHLLKTFVANRVADMQDILDPAQWFYVPSAENPADCASRGIMPSELVSHSLWWHGPQWILYSNSYWPSQNFIPTPALETTEIKPKAILSATAQNDFVFINFIERFSSFKNLQRCTSWILRFINNCKTKTSKLKCNFLTTEELNQATTIIVKITQAHHLQEEFKLIKDNYSCTSTLQRLNPFLDDQRVIRVGGRIRHSDLNYNSKHPMLIPKQSHLANLLIDHFHQVYLHAGPRLLQSLIVRQFWIISARHKIRHRISHCIKCVKLKAKSPQPYMADLPAVRLKPARPFLFCGVDYGGPILTKSDKLRKPQTLKTYICLFVCLTTKAIHLELVSSLSSEVFLAALTRFFSRRGMPSDIYSDQGTTFIGAHREINELNQFIRHPDQQQAIFNHLHHKGINWHFNPPGAPHFGGIWESGIKSVKFHLKHVIGEQKLTFEELYTLLTNVEAILNSRPLCHLPTVPEEIDSLTPGHFLVGEPLITLPNPDVTHLPLNRLSRWQLVQNQTQHFWKRWNVEYLHTLQQRAKWTKDVPNLKIGDVVLVREPNLPVMTWLMGRVTATHPGTDGVVRVATLKTKNGLLKRPVVKLCPLPID